MGEEAGVVLIVWRAREQSLLVDDGEVARFVILESAREVARDAIKVCAVK